MKNPRESSHLPEQKQIRIAIRNMKLLDILKVTQGIQMSVSNYIKTNSAERGWKRKRPLLGFCSACCRGKKDLGSGSHKFFPGDLRMRQRDTDGITTTRLNRKSSLLWWNAGMEIIVWPHAGFVCFPTFRETYLFVIFSSFFFNSERNLFFFFSRLINIGLRYDQVK